MTGRDHLMYRGYYQPVKGVIDGDLCERFMALGHDGKARIAAELEREPKEVEKKVVEISKLSFFFFFFWVFNLFGPPNL